MLHSLISRHASLFAAFVLVVGLSLSACDSAESLDGAPIAGDIAAEDAGTYLGSVRGACYIVDVFGASSIPVGTSEDYSLFITAATDDPDCGDVICFGPRTNITAKNPSGGAGVTPTASATCPSGTAAKATATFYATDGGPNAKVDIIGKMGFLNDELGSPDSVSDVISVDVPCGGLGICSIE